MILGVLIGGVVAVVGVITGAIVLVIGAAVVLNKPGDSKNDGQGIGEPDVEQNDYRPLATRH